MNDTQTVGSRTELQKVLKLYISKELHPWIKTIPDEYYKELFRLKGWQYDPLLLARPKMLGRYTNDLIFKRLPKNVLTTMKTKRPKNIRGTIH